MSLSSQSGPPQRPNSSPPRRLLSPEERFGTPQPVEPQPEVGPDPFVPLPNSPPPSLRPIKGGRSKARHERHRFEREAHRIAPRRASRTRPKAPPSNEAPQNPVPPALPAQPAHEESPVLERIRDGRRRFWKRLGAVAVLTLLVGAGAAALSAPQMNIEKVHITGLHATSPVLVKPIAARLLGHNVFLADKGAIAQSVGRLPTVERAQVVLHPDMPPRVELRVFERQPIMRVGYGSSWWVADKTGNPYRNANARDTHLPALTWAGEVQTLKPLDARRWAEAVRLVEAVEAQNGGAKSDAGLGEIRTMQLDANGDAVLTLAGADGRGDLTLKLGNDQWKEKLARARVAMLYFARTNRQAAELNLIALTLPRWTPRLPSGVSAESTPVPEATPTA